jgi:type IV pilus assembly protein PilN
MRLEINLASRPYEDARQFWMRWGTGLGALGLLTLVLLTMTISGFVNARRDHKTMAQIRDRIADRDRRRAEAEGILNLPQNRTTRDESRVLNALIERKAFSWTQVLESLEKVMPSRVHLVSINPELDEDNQLELKMTVGGDSRDRAIELARRMEESRRFAQTSIVSERSTDSNTGDKEQIDISAVYIPETPTEMKAASTSSRPAPAPAKPPEHVNPTGFSHPPAPGVNPGLKTRSKGKH